MKTQNNGPPAASSKYSESAGRRPPCVNTAIAAVNPATVAEVIEDSVEEYRGKSGLACASFDKI